MNSYRTFTAPLHVEGDGPLLDITRRVLTEVITCTGESVEALLRLFAEHVSIERYADDSLAKVTFTLPCKHEKLERAHELATKHFGLPPGAEFLAGDGDYSCYRSAGKIKCQFRNSYGVIRVSEEKITICLYRSMQAIVDDREKKLSLSVPANFVQAFLKTYVAMPFQGLPDCIYGPVTKQVAEMVTSFVGLLVEGTQRAVFPTLGECNPEKRHCDWMQGLDRVSANLNGFEYTHVEGRKRPVNTDPDWIKFVTTPFARRLALKIVADDAPVYRRRWNSQDRLWIALPIFVGASDDSRLGKLRSPWLSWWHKYVHQFIPMAHWKNKPLRPNHDIVLLPLEYDREDRLEGALSDSGRDVALCTLNEFVDHHPGHKTFHDRERNRGGKVWRTDLATSKEVADDSPLPTKVLGIHFADTPIVTWAIVDCDGNVLKQGGFEDAVLDEALLRKTRLEERQGKHQWVGGKHFRGTIEDKTRKLARRIVELAIEHDAAISLEEVTWVDKHSGGADANRRFSMWNYSRLAELIAWLGIDISTRREDGKRAILVRSVNDYVTKYTCPSCGAIRKAKQKLGVADTWRKANVLHCRKCGFEGVIPNDHVARLVAKLGADALRKQVEKLAQRA